jgi:hypothetical protein
MHYVPIDHGDAVICECCGEDCVVTTYEWELPTHMIECTEGVHIVGVNNTRVPQRTIVDCQQLDEALGPNR